MKLFTLDQIYNFYCDLHFEIKYGGIEYTSKCVECHKIMTWDQYTTLFIFDLKSDDFSDFCDCIKKYCGVIII